MFGKIITALTVLSFSAVPAIAATSVPVDAILNCFDTSTSTGTATRFQLAPGRYVASITNNKMSCNFGSLSSGCLIDTVIIRGSNQAGWGLSVKTPTVVDVSGTSNVGFTAFVVDEPCSDNTGKANLQFQKVQ